MVATFRANSIGESHGLEDSSPVYGVAQVVYDIADTTVDVRLAPDSPMIPDGSDALTWAGLPVSGGQFEHTADTDRLAGGFYGADTEEVGGVFVRYYREGVVQGAFGAERE